MRTINFVLDHLFFIFIYSITFYSHFDSSVITVPFIIVHSTWPWVRTTKNDQDVLLRQIIQNVVQRSRKGPFIVDACVKPTQCYREGEAGAQGVLMTRSWL